jgi:hypothetical protein
VGEPKFGLDRAVAVQADDVVVIAGPVEGREAGLLGPILIHGASGTHRLRTTQPRRTDTGALAGRSSLSLRRVGHRGYRRSAADPRRAGPRKPCHLRDRKRAVQSMPDGGVIHQRGRSGFPRPLPAPVINSGNRISPRRFAFTHAIAIRVSSLGLRQPPGAWVRARQRAPRFA